MYPPSEFTAVGVHVTLATPLFDNFSRDHVRTVPVDVLVKFEVRSFECIVCGTLKPCAHRQTDRQTDRHTKVKT